MQNSVSVGNRHKIYIWNYTFKRNCDMVFNKSYESGSYNYLDPHSTFESINSLISLSSKCFIHTLVFPDTLKLDIDIVLINSSTLTVSFENWKKILVPLVSLIVLDLHPDTQH